MLGQVLAALLHLDQDDRLPHVVGKRRSAAIFLRLANAVFRLPANVERPLLAKRLKQPIQKDMSLTLFVAANVVRSPLHEFREPLLSCGVHKGVVNSLPIRLSSDRALFCG